MNIKVGEINLNVLESGVKSDLPTLVFLHYFGGSSQSWREVIDALENDFYCVAPDLRGFGKSQDAVSFTIEDYARDIINLTNSLDLNSYILIGHSMGGKIALAVAAQKPENLCLLILLAASPPTPEPLAEDERQRMLTTHGKRNTAEKTIDGGVSRRLSSDVFEQAIKANLQSSEAAWRAWLETGSRRNIASIMQKIEVPIYAAVGAKDENMTAELTNREIISRVARGKLSMVEKAKHLLPLEVPHKTAKIIREIGTKYIACLSQTSQSN